MASLDQISQALLNADAAGDTEAATALAQEYRKLSKTSAVAPTVAATVAPEKPFFDLSDTLSATGRAFTSLGTSVPASMRQAFGGLENPWQRSESYTQSRADMQALQEELNASEAAAMEGGDASSVSSSIREATPSLGFSGSTLVPSLAAGAVTALATKSPVAARSAAAGTSLLMAYRMAGAQFLDDSRERIDNFFQEKLQRPLTPEEQNEAYEELLPLARKFGAAEAGPEALGNMALGGAGKYIRKALGGKNGIMSLASNALSKVTGAKAVGAGIGAAAGEVGTEAITAVEQDRINKEFEQSVLRGEAPESVVLPDRTVQDYTKGITEVAPTTLAMTGLMGLAGLGPTAINRGYRALRPQAEQQAVEAEIVPEEPTPAPPALEPPSQIIPKELVVKANETSPDVSSSTAAFVELNENLLKTQAEGAAADKAAQMLAQEQAAQAQAAAELQAQLEATTPEQPLAQEPQAPAGLPVPIVAPTVETPSPAMEMPKKSSQTPTGSNVQMGTEMPVPPPTAEAGAGVGEAIQNQPIETTPNAIQEQITDEGLLRQERPEMELQGLGQGNAQPQEVATEGQIQAEVAPPITPTQETPTTATEGTVMPGGSAMERDVTKPEQMTPEEHLNAWNQLNIDAQKAREKANAAKAKLLSKNPASQIRQMEKNAKLEQEAITLENLRDEFPPTPSFAIENAVKEGKPFSVDLHKASGYAYIPSGYTRQGDLYVFQPGATGEPVQVAPSAAQAVKATVPAPSPQTTTVATPTETAAPLAKEAAVASVVQQPAEGSIPAVEQESATTAIESNEKADIADAAMAFLEEDLTESKRQWSPEKIAAAKAYFASGGKDMDVLRAAFPKLVGSRPIVQAYLKADKDASEAQARRDAADAKLAKEIERDEKEQAKAEEAQRKSDELRLKTLNSLIQKTRTNVVQGTVNPTDANQAVAILNRSGEIPNVLFTWIGTSKDFLADPANRVRYPETWAAVSANSKIEGMSENGQPIVFTDNVGVSDLDRKLANLQGTTPEVAAVRRVILHENIHKGMFFLSMKEKMQIFSFLRRMYSPDELDSLAESYSEYADWRTNQVSYFSILEEAMTRDFDSMVEIPRDGIWAEFMQFLRGIWQKITGKTSEPTLKDYKDVFRLIRNSLKNSEKANADMLVNGGGVRIGIASKVEYDSPNDAAFNSGAEVARNTDYDERDKEVRSTIRAAYDIAPKTNGPSVPLDELFSIVKQSMPDLTETEFSRILQGLYEDSGALLIEGESPFATFTTEGERAGSVIVMPPSGFQTRAMASIVDSQATEDYRKEVDAANTGKAKAPFGGVQFTNFMPIDRAVKSAEEYSDAAIKYVNNLENEGVSLDDIANSVISPAFLESIGIEQDLMAQDALTIEVRQRVDNAARKAKSPDRKKQLSKLSERLSAFWQGVGSKKGQHLGQRRYLVNKARYSWMFIREIAEKAMKEARTNILISNFGSDNATSFTQNSYENSDKANQQAADEIAQDVVNNDEWELIKEGEQVFEGARKTKWERVKALARRFAFYARAEAAEKVSASKASMTDAERNELNAILTMPKEEREKAKAKDLAEFDKLMGDLLGEESSTDTPAEKVKRKKRKDIIDTVNKRVKAGEAIEPTEYVPIITENPQRDEIIDDVSNALLQAAKKRGVKPSQKTALADLVASIKSLLKENIKGEDLKADQAPLGQLLARTYLDNLTATEAKLFTESWNDGRKKVRAMLTEMGVEGAQLEVELNAIMPATPTIAYNPSAVRKAITRALREAGLDANDLLANTQSVKSEILKVWDKAAVDAGLTPSVWQEGRKLAEKSIDEFVIERKASKEKAKQIAKVVSEQAKNPVSLADFSNSLSQFKLNDSKVKELFDKAKVLANKKVQIAYDMAVRVLLVSENNLAQSAFFNSATKADTIVKAFRQQVSDPMSRQDFKARMDAMKVSGELADRLFDRAAREKDNAQWKRAQDMLEGPNALRNILREINRARPGEQAPLSKQIPWNRLLSQSAKTVEEYRQRIFDAISANEELKNATPEQKARLADLFAEAWESNRTRILDGMLERMIRAEEAKKNLSKEGAKALQAQRMRIVEDINLGIFDNDELAKRMAEKFGIKSEFTETEREKINSLIEVLQDEELNAVKRQVAAYKLLEVLQGELKIPVVKMLADFWVSSVLSGPNTIVSIGLAVASGAFELSTALSRVFIAGFTNPKQLPSELAGAYKTLARLLSAYGRQARIAWQYLVTGDPVFLDPSMNDVTENMQWGNIGKSNQLAEQMAKSDKILVKSAGLFMRTVSRLLKALDVFNGGLTKESSLSIVFRQIGLDPEKIAALEKKSDLKPYKDAIIQKDFGGTPPKSARDKAILDSYALADMMKELDKFGKVSENANQMAMQGAMTLEPSGLGGVGYRAIRSLLTNAEAGSDRFLKQAQRGWNDSAQNGDRILSGLELAFAYLMQFSAYNAANFGGVRFARFAGNKFNQGLSFIPGIGFARAFEAEFDSDRIIGKEAFIDSIQRNQLIGVMLSVGGYYLLKAIAEEPDDEKRGGLFINGGWNNLTPEKKQQKLAAGEKEYTIGYNNTVFSYANWPISSALAAIGSLADLIRFSPDQWNDKNVVQIMASAAMSGAAAAADIPALSQFQELFGNSLSSKDPNEKRMERFAKVMSSYAGGFVPRFLKDIDYAQDPNLRKYETLWEKTASHIPVYRRYEGKEHYDILGQQIQRNVYPGSREFMVKPTDPAYKVLGSLISRGIWLTPANAEHRMVGKGARRRSLTQEEADNYSLETGKGYKQMLLRYGQRALQMPTERARAFLLDKADEVRDRALKKVYRGYQPAT